ncbi:DLA class II histocompatibility antigen DR-1 beta chain-like [Crotalus adamanteus]|uniref:DLA class II histocompatibility antigen DR-1 beta chain-like n=1 Tax=Crotalus adamanteus TaxID=8729 RepID=A0AAW1BTB4_CROAD
MPAPERRGSGTRSSSGTGNGLRGGGGGGGSAFGLTAGNAGSRWGFFAPPPKAGNMRGGKRPPGNSVGCREKGPGGLQGRAEGEGQPRSRRGLGGGVPEAADWALSHTETRVSWPPVKKEAKSRPGEAALLSALPGPGSFFWGGGDGRGGSSSEGGRRGDQGPEEGGRTPTKGGSRWDRRFPIPPPGGAFRQSLAAGLPPLRLPVAPPLLGTMGPGVPPEGSLLSAPPPNLPQPYGTRRVRFLERLFYDRQEFVRFDSARGEFEAVTALGKGDAEALNRDERLLDAFCRYNYEALQGGPVIGRRELCHLPKEEIKRDPFQSSSVILGSA